MNIFVTDECPFESAKALDDKRVIKMILESTQLLCNALRYHGCYEPWLYKPTHVNHPCSVWARENSDNFVWLYYHTKHLCDQYYFVYKKEHKCYYLISTSYFLYEAFKRIPTAKQTPFAVCITPYDGMLDKETNSVYDCYKHYMIHKWSNDVREPTWKNPRTKPRWYV
jgi:hypothetical protein